MVFTKPGSPKNIAAAFFMTHWNNFHETTRTGTSPL